MSGAFSRSELLLGAKGMAKLRAARVIVFGVGGVGSFAAEALARSAVGEIALCDHDVVSESNLNRQLVATRETIGRAKVDVMAERIAAINPDARVAAIRAFYGPETADQFDFARYDYIIDAIDSVSSKIALIERAVREDVPIISSMGAGNKLDPTRFEVADIYDTQVCPLARVMRRELRKLGVPALKVVYSLEEPVKAFAEGERRAPGSVAFVPSVVGLILAGEVVKAIAGCAVS